MKRQGSQLRKLRKAMRLQASAQKELKAFAISGSAEFGELVAKEGGAVKQPTFAIRAYNGGAINVGWGRPVVIDGNGLRASARTPVLYGHDRSQIVGQSNEVKINKATGEIDIAGTVTGDVMAAGTPAENVVSHARRGFAWSASVGVGVDQVEAVDSKQSVNVNGRQFSGPLYVVRAGRLGEVSFVAVGADENATASIAASAAEDKDMDFNVWLKANGFDDPEKLTEKQRKVLKAQFDAEQGEESAAEPAAVTADIDGAKKQVRAAMTEETQRIASIQKLFKGKHQEICAKAIADGLTAERAELEFLKAENEEIKAARPSAPVFSTGGKDAVNASDAIEASLLATYHILPEDKILKRYGEKVMEAAASKQFRNASLSDLFHMVINAAGMHARPGRMTIETIETAIEAERKLKAGFSSLSLPGILSNVANKALLDRFQASASVVSRIAYETDTPDFKSFKRYRLDSSGAFAEVGSNGELGNIKLVESEFTNQLKTQGGMLTLTRQAMINDDMGAFLQLPQIFAELAIQCRELAVFTLINANAGSFFGTGNLNYFSGSDSVLQVTSLDTAVKKFIEQKNAGGFFLLAQPGALLVPPALAGQARRLYSSDMLLEAATAGKPQPATNTYKGSFEPVVSPYLGTASGLSGASDTAWYLLANPQPGAAIVQVGYLAGQRTPVFEQGPAEFNTLGISFRGYFDFGAALFEPRAGVKSKGAS